MKENRICQLFNIDFPIISGGMVWCSGHELVSAVSEAGGLGLLGAGSMYPEVLLQHIQKVKKTTNKPFGVNIPLMYPNIEEIIKIVINEQVPIVFTSAGNPKTWTPKLKAEGIKVVHVVSSSKFAKKSEEAGVDAIVAEGFEAGGHNGKEETTTLCLVPSVVEAVNIPVLAAGGIGSGKAMAAAFCLGAEGVQIGSAFAITQESSCHFTFKEKCTNLNEGDTMLLLKKLAPARLIMNDFAEKAKEAELRGADKEEMKELLGRGRAKKGMFLGDLSEGELEIGQVAYQIKDIPTVAERFQKIKEEFISLRKNGF